MRLPLACALALLLPAAAAAQKHIVPADPLSPADERKAFTVPPGFEVQLVAAEPDIQKPIQTAFDARGRLWVTTSHLYPFPAPVGKGTDKLFVLSDFAADGKARKVEVFADTLNIPIGVLPLPDGKSCLVGSVGQILKLADTDNDGKADKTEVLFEGFGFKDTHGMMNSFTLMPDGWVYATHGFSNESRVKGKDGHEVVMQSGNTFRFRLDGSRIEVFTRGQVNPFGIAVDPWFNLYTADCHSKPVTQLIRGATYQSFSKPHDGLGFAPHVTRHDHGSTALCGLTWYDADHFPPEYRGNLFLGNVVTSRINADAIVWHGSTPEAKEKPDFLTSTDGWFRPADVRLGPDGALYVADFYNRIIGHYEVPLTHPQRDKDRGRVWRIVWKGLDGKAKPPAMPFADLTAEKAEKVDELLGHPNLTVRLLATHELIRRDEAMKVYESTSDVYTAHREWVLDSPMTRRDQSRKRPSSDKPLVAAHMERVDTACEEWQRERGEPNEVKRADRELAKLDPQVARAVVDRMAAVPEAANVKPLVELLKAVPADDTHLKFAARVALRNTLRNEKDDVAFWKSVYALVGPDAAAGVVVADAALGVPNESAATFLACHALEFNLDPPRSAEVAEHIGRYAPLQQETVLRRVRMTVSTPPSPGQLGRAFGVLRGYLRGVQAGGEKILWGTPLATDRLFKTLATDVRNEPASAKTVVDVLLLLPTVSDKAAGSDTADTCARVLSDMVGDKVLADDVRIQVIDALGRSDVDAVVVKLLELLQDPATGPALRDRIALALASMPNTKARSETKVLLKTAPYRLAVPMAVNMAATKNGAEELLNAVQTGATSARLLQDKAVLDRLKASKLPDVDKRVAALTKGLPPADQRLADLIKGRAAAFTKAKPDAKAGAALFAKSCAACHQVGGQGGKVGPNLDGVGSRGPERLCEDVLDPNRNVDAAFRSRTLRLADGRAVSGLMLRVEGKVIVMADADGKEVRVPEADVESNVVTALSPMPANFDAVIPEADFPHLLAYLLELKAKQ